MLTPVVGIAAIGVVSKLGSYIVVNHQKEGIFSRGKTLDAMIIPSDKVAYARAKKILKKKRVYVNVLPETANTKV